MDKEPGRLQSMGSLGVRYDWATLLSLFTFMHWRRKWQPIPVSCLENSRDGGGWWAAVYGVTQSWTRLMRLRRSSGSQVSLDLLFVHSSPLERKGNLFWVLVIEGLVGLHRTVKLQLFQLYWWGHRLGLPWYWMICLGNEQRSFCCFWDCIWVLHFGLFRWLWWLFHFF